MTTKLCCPHCGRCIGISTSSDGTGRVTVLTEKPSVIMKTQFVHGTKCIRCKAINYILTEFIEK